MYIFIFTYVYIYIYIHICMYEYIYIYTYMCVCFICFKKESTDSKLSENVVWADSQEHLQTPL